MAKRVLVTGSSGSFGANLVRALLDHPLVQLVVGADDRPATAQSHPRCKRISIDIRDSVYFRSVLEQHEIDAVYHPVSLAETSPRTPVERTLHIEGTQSLLDAADKTPRLQRLILLSSATAYGARRDNPKYLDESHPLRAAPGECGFWARDMEELVARRLPDLRASLQVSIFRPCNVARHREWLTPPANALQGLPFGISPAFADCAWQCLAESDLLRTLTRVLEIPGEIRGAFNVAPDDFVPLSSLCRRYKPRNMRLPPALIPATLRVAALGRDGRLAASAGCFAHSIIIDNAKIKRALGLRFDTGSETAFDMIRSAVR